MKLVKPQDIPLLIENCKENHPKAQRDIYQHLAGKMFAICNRYGKDRMAAEDILQMGFVKLFRQLNQFRSTGDFEAWARRIFVNTAIDYYRQAVNKESAIDITEDIATEAGQSGLDQLQLADLLKLIARLPDGYRMVFNLYIVEGYSHKEIATRLGISESGSKSQLSRARQLLKGAIEKREEVIYEK